MIKHIIMIFLVEFHLLHVLSLFFSPMVVYSMIYYALDYSDCEGDNEEEEVGCRYFCSGKLQLHISYPIIFPYLF